MVFITTCDNIKKHCIVLFSDITRSNGKGVVFMTTCDNMKQHCNLFQTLPEVMMVILRLCLYTVLLCFCAYCSLFEQLLLFYSILSP